MEACDEEDRGDHPPRAPAGGAGHARRARRVPPDRDRGHGLRAPEGLHRAVPRLAREHLAAAQAQGRIGGLQRRGRQDGRGDHRRRLHGRDRRRARVRVGRRAGGTHPHRRARRGHGAPRGAGRLGVLSDVGLWARAKRVIADDGRPTPIPIDIERAPDGSYAFRLGVRAGFGGQETARIPIEQRVNPEPHPILKEIHSCEVGGRALEAANVYALRGKVAAQLESISPGRSLPLLYFRAPAMDYELPVYEDGGRMHAPVIGGPRLRAGDMAGIRRHVCRYLVNAGYLREPDEVIVGVLRPRDLRRVPPAAVFRDLEDDDVWLPSVEGVSVEGPVVGVLGRAPGLRWEERARAGQPRIAAESSPAATDVVELLRYLRTAGMGGALYA